MGYYNGIRYDSTPSREAESVTPNDSTDLDRRTKGIWVGSSGDLSVVMHNGDVVIFPGVLGGSLLPIAVSRVRATGTTATGIVALY